MPLKGSNIYSALKNVSAKTKGGHSAKFDKQKAKPWKTSRRRRQRTKYLHKPTTCSKEGLNCTSLVSALHCCLIFLFVNQWAILCAKYSMLVQGSKTFPYAKISHPKQREVIAPSLTNKKLITVTLVE
jgi:hypothetical protein